jgi:hypothetical protein
MEIKDHKSSILLAIEMESRSDNRNLASGKDKVKFDIDFAEFIYKARLKGKFSF